MKAEYQKMKYRPPFIRLVEVVDCDEFIAVSIPVGEGETDDGGWVKEEFADENGGGGGHNGNSVWDDDWSQSIW